LTSLLEPSATSSPLGARIGTQQPREHRAAPYVHTYGHQVNDFMSQIGRPGYPWQQQIVLDAFGVRADGLWSNFELLVLLARQNGKGWVTEAIELGSLFLFREPMIMHSAHLFNTARLAFRRIVDIIDGSDWLTKRVKSVSRSRGDEGIELTRAAGGGQLLFVARTVSAGRGFTGSKNVFDEAWKLSVAEYAAQTPTLATIPNPQIIYTTTPPDEDLGPPPEDAMLPSVRKRARAGSDRMAVYEWSPPDGFDRADRNVWYECNPTLGLRISEWFLAQQLNAFTEAGRPGKFDTEHLGLYPPDEAAQWLTIGKTEWTVAANIAPPPAGRVAFGLEVEWDRSRAAFAVAWRRADVLRQVELTQSDQGIDHRAGTGWCVGRARELLTAWPGSVLALDPGGPAGSLVKDLEDANIPFTPMNTTDAGRAYGDFYDAFAGADLARRDGRHGNQDALNKAVAGAVERRIGDARAWDRKASTNFCPLGAATAALWALRNMTVPRSKVY
jgi:hypothetical protein